MPRYWPTLSLLAAVVCGFVATLLVAASIHWWRFPIDAWVPSPWSLFFPPYALTALVLPFVVGRAWRLSSIGHRLVAGLFALCGPIIGVLISIPAVCIIAKECL